MTEMTERTARAIRKAVVRMHRRGSGVGSALSIADILAVLYFDVMNIASPDDPRRDRFILSKSHAVAALYAALALKGWLRRDALEQFLADGSDLMAHASGRVPGIEAPTGSLGHGLALAAGMALAARSDGRTHRVFVVLGDGECQEGSVWEAAMLAAQLRLDRIVAVVDANGWQGYGRTDDVLPSSTLAAKWTAFGWSVRQADGHRHDELCDALSSAPWEAGRPSALIARTIKGKGVGELEDRLESHYLSVPAEKLAAFLDELDRS